MLFYDSFLVHVFVVFTFLRIKISYLLGGSNMGFLSIDISCSNCTQEGLLFITKCQGEECWSAEGNLQEIQGLDIILGLPLDFLGSLSDS